MMAKRRDGKNLPQRRRLERLETLARHLRPAHLVEPPEGVVRRAAALGDGLVPGKVGWLDWLAELLFDSALAPLPAGVRSAGRDERRLLYRLRASCAGADEEAPQLDLRIRREPSGAVELTGQLLPPWPEARVVARGGRVRREGALGANGEFLLRSLPARAAHLRLEIEGSGRQRLVLEELPSLPVGPREGA